MATALLLLGIVSPAIVALGLTVRAGGRERVRHLLGRLVEWRVGVRWYAFAVGYIVAVKLAAAVAARAIVGEWPTFGPSPLWLLFGTIGSTLLGGQVGEELGWRGYALPRLTDRWGWRSGSLVLGVIWAVWHLPLFYMPGADTYGQSFPLYLSQVTGLSVAIAWLYGRVEGSLVPVMLMHASLNNLTNIVPGVARPAASPWLPHAALQGWLTAGAIWVAAIWFLVEMRQWDRVTGPRPVRT
jgi:membrane protease YdiL (CAAX protease family)